MKINELKNFLVSNKVPENLYSLKGGLPSEAYCINKTQEKWEVYYSERGIKSHLIQFDTEDSACLYLQEIIKKILCL